MEIAFNQTGYEKLHLIGSFRFPDIYGNISQTPIAADKTDIPVIIIEKSVQVALEDLVNHTSKSSRLTSVLTFDDVVHKTVFKGLKLIYWARINPDANLRNGKNCHSIDGRTTSWEIIS
jgi:hypothetical protein